MVAAAAAAAEEGLVAVGVLDLLLVVFTGKVAEEWAEPEGGRGRRGGKEEPIKKSGDASEPSVRISESSESTPVFVLPPTRRAFFFSVGTNTQDSPPSYKRTKKEEK